MGNDAAWPRHPHKEWEETLAFARRCGWSLQTHSAHAFGTLRCPGGRCEIKVLSTGRGAESVARRARTKIMRCPHVRDLSHWAVRAHDALTKSERLLEAAWALLQRDDAEREFAQIPDDGRSSMTRVDELISQIDHLTAVAEAALATVSGGDAVHTVSDASAAVGSELDDARGAVRDAPPRSAEAKNFRSWLRTQRDEHRQLQSRIESKRSGYG